MVALGAFEDQAKGHNQDTEKRPCDRGGDWGYVAMSQGAWAHEQRERGRKDPLLQASERPWPGGHLDTTLQGSRAVRE